MKVVAFFYCLSGFIDSQGLFRIFFASTDMAYKFLHIA